MVTVNVSSVTSFFKATQKYLIGKNFVSKKVTNYSSGDENIYRQIINVDESYYRRKNLPLWKLEKANEILHEVIILIVCLIYLYVWYIYIYMSDIFKFVCLICLYLYIWYIYICLSDIFVFIYLIYLYLSVWYIYIYLSIYL